MKNIRVFLSEIFQFLEVKFSIHLNRRVFVMVIVTNCLELDKTVHSAASNLDVHCMYRSVLRIQILNGQAKFIADNISFYLFIHLFIFHYYFSEDISFNILY